jgi:carboxymethylenebutenolidase
VRASGSLAQDESEGEMAEPISIPSPGIPLYFGEPGSAQVILVHDYYGRLPWLVDYAEALARIGFRVVVPDFYDGIATTDADLAERLMEDLDVAQSLTLIDDAIQEARDEGTHRIGTIGFSMGGWLALLHAQGGATDAVAAYYATLAPEEHGVIPCPVLLNFAEADEWAEHEDPESFIDRLKDHGTPVSDYSYLATVHSFANASIPEKFNAAAAALAYARTASFLEDQLAD